MSASSEVPNWEEGRWVGLFLDHLTLERRLSIYTRRNYNQAISRFFQWLREKEGWGGDLNGLEDRQVRDYVIESQRRLSRRTIHNHFSALRSFYHFLLKRKVVEKNPFSGITLPKLEKNLPKFLTERQISALLDGPMQLQEKGSLSPARAWRDRLVLEFLYGGGLRVSELVSLNYGMIDEKTGISRILGKGKKERICPLGKVAMACLAKFRAVSKAERNYGSPILLNDRGRRMSVRQVQRLVKKYLALAELPMDMSPHKIRHSYATHLLNNGADLRLVQELLGHASLSSTQIYTHVGIARLKNTHRKAHPRG